MIRIEYSNETMNGARMNFVMFADSFDEAEEICRAIESHFDDGYRIEDVSNYIEE